MVGRNLHCFYYKYTFFFLKKQVKTKKTVPKSTKCTVFFLKITKKNKKYNLFTYGNR